MSVEIFVEGEGLDDVQVMMAPKAGSRHAIVEFAAGKGGFPAADAFLFVEDGDEPLDLAVILGDDHDGRIHHVHRLRAVEVTVFYGGREIDKSFSPATRIGRVLEWAVGKHGFKIDPAIAPEMELALHGQTEALPKKAHLGRFVRAPRHKLKLDLIRGVIPNGAPA